ncbi:MAG: hypothetical protein K2L59_00455 [Muribaculaceae bacterium]|nr:hypothetical protein [Muribaculaceae bacterium]
MKKFLLLASAFCVFGAFAQNTKTVTFYAEGSTAPTADESVVLPTGNVAGNTYSSDFVNIKFVKVSSSTSNVTSSLVRWYASDKIELSGVDDAKVTALTLVASGTSYVKDIKNESGTVLGSWSGTTWTYDLDEAADALTIVASAQIRFSSLTVTCDASVVDNREKVTLTFPESSYTATLGESFDSPEVSASVEGLVYSWESSDPDVASVDSETGVVSILTPGFTTITVRSEETEVYRSGEGSYELLVIDPNKTDAAFDFTKEPDNLVFQDGVVNVVFAADGGTAPKWYEDGSAIRFYAKNTVTISVPEGYRLVDAVFTTSSTYPSFNNGTTCKNADDEDFGTFSNLKWSAGDDNGNTLVIKNGGTSGQVRIQTLKVNFALETGVAGIEAEENAAPVYYNLQGVRVAQPENGLYIEVKGNSSRKVFVGK